MDISETYIKMCEKGREIQALKEHSPITHFQTMDGSIIDIKGDYIVWLPKPIPDYQRDYPIWLPRQDQLQEMVGGLEAGFIDFPKWLAYTYGLNYGDKPNGHLHIFTTWEQLWLAFVMKEKYNKTWDGEDWVKQPVEVANAN